MTRCIGTHGYHVINIRGDVKCMHEVIVEKALGRPLKRPEQVHHVDEDKINNSPGNLVVCPDQKYHYLLHLRARAFRESGHYDWRRCSFCKTWDDPAQMWFRANGAKSGSYAHRSCFNAYRRRYNRRKIHERKIKH